LFTTNAIDDQPLPMYKGGEHNVRDWLYVDDHCSGIDVALRKGAFGQVYNDAGGNERENIVLTKKILDLVGKVWKTRITEWEAPVRFVDVQLSGPYRVWEHTHEFQAVSGGTIVRDTVDYELPAGWLGELLRRTVVARDIARIFEYRRGALAQAFESVPHDRYASADPSTAV
jgi:ligand-binding SRPBCC domain-containing protein